ncbi:MAG: tetratricopeptide repeat protein, partial [Candidatus Polarisedimenticolia bacterium]
VAPPAEPAPTIPSELFESAAKAEPRPEPEGGPDGGYVDLAAMILDEPVEHTTRWTVEYQEPAHNEEADFGEILAQFKQHVSQHLERSDARAHYDLGSAYKGMGLVQEAIAMFQKALRAEPDFLPAIEMLGRCFIENGDVDAGIKVLGRGLNVNVPVEDDLLGIYYYLGSAHESQGHKDTAKDFYMRVFACDINFLDVTDRLRALRSA